MESTNLRRFKDVYDEHFAREQQHQETCRDYEHKISKIQVELSGRILEEKERSTQLTAAFMTQNQRRIEKMHALMMRIQSAVLSDRDCVPLSQLQARIFTLGNDQLDTFNRFIVLSTDNSIATKHIRRMALTKKMSEMSEEIRKNLRAIDCSLSSNSTIDDALKLNIQRSVAAIERAIQSFLRLLRNVLNRGESMQSFDAITAKFDGMHDEIVKMPPLNSASALEVIETGLQQIAIEDSCGQEAIGSSPMIRCLTN